MKLVLRIEVVLIMMAKMKFIWGFTTVKVEVDLEETTEIKFN